MGSRVRVIENSEGSRTTPSVVAFLEDGTHLVGAAAKRQAIVNPNGTFYAVKRLIGRSFEDQTVQKDAASLPYKIVPGPQGEAWVADANDVTKKYSPPYIGSLVLRKMKETAETYLNRAVKDAVITVPAYFNDSQRQATKEAGHLAGFNVRRIVNEPTAAALGYGLEKRDGTIAVFDLGGGTFDISILSIRMGVCEVKATNGDTHLGGEDFDCMIMDFLSNSNIIFIFLVAKFEKQTSINIRSDTVAMQRVREAAEKCKIELSSKNATEVILPFLAVDQKTGLPRNFTAKVTRAELETLVDTLIQRCKAPVISCCKDAGVKIADIDEILLVGGMTRMPRVQKLVKDLFRKTPNKGVNPDEIVASGAAVQCGVLLNSVSNVVLLEVCPLTLSTEIDGGTVVVAIPRNTTIPVKKTFSFTTVVPHQRKMRIQIWQGEHERAVAAKEHGMPGNQLLGEFFVSDIMDSTEAGVPNIEVQFEIDANGLVTVTALNKDTGTSSQLKIDASLQSPEQPIAVPTVVADSTASAENVGKVPRIRDLLLEAEGYVRACRKYLDLYGDRRELLNYAFNLEKSYVRLQNVIARAPRVSVLELEAKIASLSEDLLTMDKYRIQGDEGEARSVGFRKGPEAGQKVRDQIFPVQPGFILRQLDPMYKKTTDAAKKP